LDVADWEPAALRERVLRAGVPLYGLAAPSARRRWLDGVGSTGVTFGYEMASGGEITIGAGLRPSRSSYEGQDYQASYPRLRLAEDMLVKARYPQRGAVDKARDWWKKLVDSALAEANTLAADPSQWNEVVLSVESADLPAWHAQVGERWCAYCEVAGHTVFAAGTVLGPEQVRIASFSPTELGPYILGIPAIAPALPRRSPLG
jgi:hypothetical protein